MSERKEIVIGIDASTTACKAIAWDTHGNAIATERAQVVLHKPHPDWYEQTAEDWWETLKTTLQTISQRIDTQRLAGICICLQRETFVPVDKAGRPQRNAILWMDERARSLLPEIETCLGSEKFHQITGKPLSGNLTIAKILWLRELEPSIFEQTNKFVDVAAYLNFKLTGEFATSWGIADPTGMFDMQVKQWAAPILDFLSFAMDQLPTPYAPGSIIGYLTPEAAKRCGLPASLPVIAGLGDGQAAGLGANLTSPGQAYLSLGTSVVSGTYTEKYVTDRAFRTMLSIPGAYSLETVLLGGAYTIDWFQENFAHNRSLAELEGKAAKIPPGSEGLMLVPYWNSVMNPYWDADASGITLGWRGHHKPAHLYRAILEGIAFELRLHFEGVETAIGQEIEKLTAMGGGSRSDLWCQTIADVTGKTIHRAQITEATALGAGILAAVGADLFPDFHQATNAMSQPPKKKFKSDQTRNEVYSKLFEQAYVNIFPALQSTLKNLNRLNDQL